MNGEERKIRWVFISDFGELLPIAREFEQNGQWVTVCLYKNPMAVKQKVYRGLLNDIRVGLPPISRSENKSDKFLIPTRDVIVFENSIHDKLAEQFLRAGFMVLGCNPLMKKLELERWNTIEFVRKLSIPVPETIRVRNEEQLNRVRVFRGKKCVIKEEAQGYAFNTRICDDGDEAIEVIRDAHREGSLSFPIIVQEFIEGIEISTEAWFSHGKFIPPLNSTFEDKKFLAGDLGVNTGCMSSVVFNWKDTLNSRPFRQIFRFVIDVMKVIDYTGPIDVNTIISFKDHRMYFLEFTPRFGYNAIFAWKHLLTRPLWEVWMELLSGFITELPVVYDKFSFALRITVFPYPHTPIEIVRGKEINHAEGLPLKFPQTISKNFYLLDVRKKRVNSEELEVAGMDGVVGELVDVGNTIEEARQKVFKMAEMIKVPHKQYRVDAGERAKKCLEILKEWRWYDGV